MREGATDWEGESWMLSEMSSYMSQVDHGPVQSSAATLAASCYIYQFSDSSNSFSNKQLVTFSGGDSDVKACILLTLLSEQQVLPGPSPVPQSWQVAQPSCNTPCMASYTN